MLNRLLETVRKYSLLKLFLGFHGMAVAILVAGYYSHGDKLWHAALVVMIGGTVPVYPVRGPSLLLPWNLLPHDVAWLALDALVWGTLVICLTYWLASDEVKKGVAQREKAAADKLLEAAQRSAVAGRRMQEAESWEQAARAAERLAEERELMAARRDEEARAYMASKDEEVGKMSGALTRLKGEAKDLRKEVSQLRQRLSGGEEKE